MIMKRLLLSLLLIAAVTPALNACSTDSSTLGNLDRFLYALPDTATADIMGFCGSDIRNSKIGSLNKAGRNKIIEEISKSPCMAGASEAHITDYAHAVIKTTKAPQWVHDALLNAAKVGDVAAVTRLLTAPFIDVNARDITSFTALIYSASHDHAEVVRLLLAAPRIDVNTRNTYGWTALHWAAYSGHAEVVRLLLADLRTDVNTGTNFNSTALILAAYFGHAGIVAALLTDPRTTADTVNLRDRDGNTALDRARARGHHEIATMIEAYLAAHPEAAAH
jgi:ankyrin repeat protein